MFKFPEKQPSPCFCIGPQKGETLCPCKLREAQQRKFFESLVSAVPVKPKERT